MTTSTNTIILGAGQAGLALSRGLTDLGRDHLILERGRVAERWRSERWDSLRLLTPNWMTRLPGFRYDGAAPNGFMSAGEVTTFFDRYASSFDAPVREHTTVERVRTDGEHFVVTTDDGEFLGDNVVIATGWCDRPAVPTMSRQLSPLVHQIDPVRYRNPDSLPAGGVLVVGASATGVQLADELRATGREVTIAVGSHSRLPRRYRGMDVFWWLDLLGSFDRTIDDVGDPHAARFEPSVQLVGRLDHRTLDLATLQSSGVRLVGRLTGVDGTRTTFADDLPATLHAADRQMANVLRRIDQAVDERGLGREVLEPTRPPRVTIGPPTTSLDLTAEGITSVIWATGHRRPYEWLDLPILDRRGEIGQYRGVTRLPGAYVLGQRFQHFRNSNFIDGVGRDALYVADQIGRTHHPLRDLMSSQPREK